MPTKKSKTPVTQLTSYDRLIAARRQAMRNKQAEDRMKTFNAALAYYGVPEKALRAMIVANWLDGLHNSFPSLEAAYI